MERITDASPRVFRPKFMGRMVGVGYLVMTASGFDLFYVLAKLYVRGDAAATAANIKAHEELFLAGFAAALIGVASSLVVTALFYHLYEPVNRTLSLCAALFGLTGCVIQGVALIFHLMPVLILADQPYLHALTLDQRQALALLLLLSYGQVLQLAYLTFRSTFLPRWLGVHSNLHAALWMSQLRKSSRMASHHLKVSAPRTYGVGHSHLRTSDVL